LDIDFRPDQWHDARAFGVAIRSALRLADIVLGTEDEINAATMTDPALVQATTSVSDTKVRGDVDRAIATMLGMGPKALLQKRGQHGARVHLVQSEGGIQVMDAPGYPVEIANILGAGDAFAAGFIYGHLHEWGWRKAARLGNACGAIVVTKHGCANFMPTFEEVMRFIETHGGID
jgi:5-dehydro-2-deoxygluconokinase